MLVNKLFLIKLPIRSAVLKAISKILIVLVKISIRSAVTYSLEAIKEL